MYSIIYIYILLYIYSIIYILYYIYPLLYILCMYVCMCVLCMYMCICVLCAICVYVYCVYYICMCYSVYYMYVLYVCCTCVVCVVFVLYVYVYCMYMFTLLYLYVYKFIFHAFVYCLYYSTLMMFVHAITCVRVRVCICDVFITGTYNPSIQSSSCIVCSPGTYQIEYNGTTCIACPAGKYSNTAGLTSACTNCAAGYTCNIIYFLISPHTSFRHHSHIQVFYVNMCYISCVHIDTGAVKVPQIICHIHVYQQMYIVQSRLKHLYLYLMVGLQRNVYTKITIRHI